MKRRFFAVAGTLAVTLFVSFGFAGCKPSEPDPEPEPPHSHVFSDWLTDEEKHWQECTVCHQILIENTHTFDNVTGFEYPAYLDATMPMLRVTTPADKTGEVYIKEVWACLTKKEGASLRVAYSPNPEGTFAGYVDISAEEGGWTKMSFPNAGLRAKLYSYFRLQAVGDSLTVREIIFFGSDEEGKETYFLMNVENTGPDFSGQEGNRQKGLIDEQQFPNEKRECTVCHYPEPKTQE